MIDNYTYPAPVQIFTEPCPMDCGNNAVNSGMCYGCWGQLKPIAKTRIDTIRSITDKRKLSSYIQTLERVLGKYETQKLVQGANS